MGNNADYQTISHHMTAPAVACQKYPHAIHNIILELPST